MSNLRHESSSQRLEEESDKGSHGGDVASKTADKGKQASDERNGAEEERDQVEGKHEPREEEEFFLANELLRDASLGAKVTGRIEWVSRLGRAAVGIEAVFSAADGEESPSRRVERAGDVVGSALQEVEFVQGRAVHTASQDGEELQQQCAGDKHQRQDREKRSYKVSVLVMPVHNYCIKNRVRRTSRAHCDLLCWFARPSGVD
jgi:hypothetical protein